MKKCALWLCSSALLFSACADNIEDTRTLELPAPAADSADATVTDTAVDVSAAQTAFAPAMGPDATEAVLQSDQTPAPGAGATIQNRDGELARVPLFALIPVGPSQARLLWVPWSGAGVRYSVEHSPPGTVPKWTPIRAEIDSDSALVYGVGAADQLRVVAWNEEDVRVGESVDLAFSPVEAAEPLLAGRNVIDGRSQGWIVGETLVNGLGSAPLAGDILILPMVFERDENVVREVISTSSTVQGWSAATRPFEWRLRQSKRAGVAANISLDGLPLGLLQEGSDGYRGYCSVSGWGCIEFRADDLEVRNPSRKLAADFDIIRRSWSRELYSAQGIAIMPSANAGVKLGAEGDYCTWCLTAWGRAKIVAYADGGLDAAIATTSAEFTIPSYEIYRSARIRLFTVLGFSFEGDASLRAIGSFSGSSSGTEGFWLGDVNFERGYELGYESRRGFYGQSISDQDLSISPQFGDGSFGEARAGLEAAASIYSLPLDAELNAQAELAFSHNSTAGLPCGQTASILSTDIALLSSLGYVFNLAVLDTRVGTFATYRTPISGWGINRVLSMPDQLQAGAPQQFRVLSSGNPQPQSSSGSPMPPIGWDALQVYVDGVLAPQPTIVSGRYQFAEALPAGDHEIGVWIPEGVHGQALRAPGVCLSRSVSVDGAP
jgi:hypothetical protein